MDHIKHERGLALMEFVLVTAFFLAPLMFIVVDFGRCLYQYNVLSQAVNHAARYWSANFYNTDGITPSAANKTTAESLVAQHLGASCTGMSSACGNTTVPGLSVSPGEQGDIPNSGQFTPSTTGIYVKIKAQYNYSWISPIPSWFGLTDPIPLQASSVIRITQ